MSVPDTICPLTMQELHSNVDPLASSSEYGLDLYERTVEFIGRKLIWSIDHCQCVTMQHMYKINETHETAHSQTMKS